MFPKFIISNYQLSVNVLRLTPALTFHTTANSCGYKLATNIKDCYFILRVDEDADEAALKEAYIQLAKVYHPDSDTSTADANKFSQIEQAYRTIQAYRKEVAKKKQDQALAERNAEDMEIFDIKHTAPQHRQYLSYEGKGAGNPFQREKQYKAYKVMRASENVHEHQMQKISGKYEDALVAKDKEATRKRTIRNAMERLVEDYIQEAMAKGEFSNLKGAGKPLQLPPDHNPMIDKTTHQLNRILINNGFAPEWIMLEKDIRQSIKAARHKLLVERTRAGPDLKQLSIPSNQRWQKTLQDFKLTIQDINKKIQRLNLITPTLAQQMFPYNEAKELNKVIKEYQELSENGELPTIEEDRIIYEDILRPPKDSEKMTFKMVWKDIRELFSS